MVEFETGQLSAHYAGKVTDAAAIWSKSSCLNAVAVETCSSGANCVSVVEDETVNATRTGKWIGKGAATTWKAQPSPCTRSRWGRTTDNGALATIVHEMGHALGLDHRLKRSDVMNSVTGDNTNPVPDAVDFSNLAAIYGSLTASTWADNRRHWGDEMQRTHRNPSFSL